MATSDDTIAVVQDIHDFVFKTLRERLPFMKDETVHGLVEDMTQTARDRIEADEPVMTATKAAFDFFSIPPELRNRIYEYTLVYEDEDTRGFKDSFPAYDYLAEHDAESKEERKERKKKYPEDRLTTWPALLCVNKQMLKEALPIHLGQNTFILNIGRRLRHGYGCKVTFNLLPWLTMLGHERTKLVKDLVIQYDGSSLEYIRSELPNQPRRYEYDGYDVWQASVPALTRQYVLNAFGLGGYGLPPDAIKVRYQNLPWRANEGIMELLDDGSSKVVAKGGK